MFGLNIFVHISATDGGNVLQVAYAGVFPSHDWEGNELPLVRKALAGKPIAGGPYALTEVRRLYNWKKHVNYVES